MMIPCVSCDSMFRLDNNLVKSVGSKVRCSKCYEIFMVYPPEHGTASCTKNSSSNGEVAVVIPHVLPSLLDDLFRCQINPNIEAAAAGTNMNEESDNNSVEPIEDFEEVEEEKDIEYAELPSLSEIEEVVDSILDEKNYLKNISPYMQSKCTLQQDFNISGV